MEEFYSVTASFLFDVNPGFGMMITVFPTAPEGNGSGGDFLSRSKMCDQKYSAGKRLTHGLQHFEIICTRSPLLCTEHLFTSSWCQLFFLYRHTHALKVTFKPLRKVLSFFWSSNVAFLWGFKCKANIVTTCYRIFVAVWWDFYLVFLVVTPKNVSITLVCFLCRDIREWCEILRLKNKNNFPWSLIKINEIIFNC